MFAILRSAWIWIATLSLVILWVPVLGVVRLFDRDPLHFRTGRWFRRLGRIISRVNPWRLHISGTEHIQSGARYVVVSNHQSLADIPLISHLRIDAKWLAKAELFRIPFAGWLMKMVGDVPVDRSDRRKAAKALLQCAKLLRKGCSLVFFPEGTRSHNGEVLPFNDGPFQLAIREKAPVLPLVVEGSGEALPRHSWIFRHSQDIYLRVLEPVDVTAFGPNQTGELRDSVRQQIIDELTRMRKQ